MKLAMRGLCALALALVLAGLALHLSAAGLSAAQAATRDTLAGGAINLGGKLAIIAALTMVFIGSQRFQWGWVAVLALTAALTLFSGPLSALTNTGAVFYIVSPVVAALATIAYTFRMQVGAARV